ncbi:MAG: shikimate dehydrogenase family protein [Candidatus Puniceispirillaceae bacterium]
MSGSELSKITGTTDVFACIAYPASHVRAPMIFNRIFLEKDLDNVMVALAIPPEGLAAAMEGLRALGNFKGAAVTIPHKMPLAALCDELGPGAQAAEAVNAIAFTKDRRLIGDNFDGEGFVAGLRGENPCGDAEGKVFTDKKILLIGAGGAGRAIALALAGCDVGQIDITNRTPENAEKAVRLAKKIVPDARMQTIAGEAVKFDSYDMVINATPLGLHGDDPMPFDVHLLSESCLVCDIIMVPERTALIDAAEARGLKVHLGRHMLDYQMQLIGKFIGAI